MPNLPYLALQNATYQPRVTSLNNDQCSLRSNVCCVAFLHKKITYFDRSAACVKNHDKSRKMPKFAAVSKIRVFYKLCKFLILVILYMSEH